MQEFQMLTKTTGMTKAGNDVMDIFQWTVTERTMDVNFPIEPPVNNLIQPTVYDRLGALAFERIRVANSQLETRLSIQERVLNKHRTDAERVHQNQRRKMRREMRKIRKKRPDYVGDFDEAVGNKSLSDTHRSLNAGRYRTMSEPTPTTLAKTETSSRHRSLSETNDSCYCRRYYSHHFQIKDVTREEREKDSKKRKPQTDFFNARLRCFFLSLMNSCYHKDHDTVLTHPSLGAISDAEEEEQEEEAGTTDRCQELDSSVFS